MSSVIEDHAVDAATVHHVDDVPSLHSLNGKYGLVPVDDLYIEVCKANPLITPVLSRYLGMGHCEAIGVAVGHPDKFFIINLGGSNRYECDDNDDIFKHLTLKDSVSYSQVVSYVSRTTWDEIIGVENGDRYTIHQVITHNASDQ